MTDNTTDRITQIKARWAEVKELHGSWYFNETDYTVCYHLDGHGEIDIAETHSNVSGELIAGATGDIYALIAEVDRLKHLDTIIGMLAQCTDDSGLRTLCNGWGVTPIEDMSRLSYTNGEHPLNIPATIKALVENRQHIRRIGVSTWTE